MGHGVVRTDLMHGTDVRAGLVSVKYIVTTGSGTTESPYVHTPTAIDNGNVLLLGDLMDGEREIYKGSAVAANSPLKDVVLVDSPEVMYDERFRDLADYYNVAGKPCRGYRLHKWDVFSLTADALAFATNETTDGKVGSIVELKAGTKLQAKTGSATSGSTVVGKIIAIDVVGKYTFYVIRVTE